VGSFHRAHQAVYLDDLAKRGGDWGEIGVGLLPRDRPMADALGSQGGLYTVLVRSAEGDRARVVGCLLDYALAPENTGAVLALLADPGTRLVTLTITEGGYNVVESTGRFDSASADVIWDLSHHHMPTTVFGYLSEALDRRRRDGVPPFTLLSCDNVQGNGRVARSSLVSFARLRDESLANWIEESVAFPSSMVDRITPQTTKADQELVEQEFGVADRWPVVTEPFSQWVLEDAFCNGRPALERVGVQLVTDVHPYETMKLRLLNASHAAIGFLGYVAGYRTVDEVMADSLFRSFMERQMREEVAPLLPPVPGIDVDEYQRTLVERFCNPRIRDQVARVCLGGSAKVPKFLLPPLYDALNAGLPHRRLTLALAGWLRYVAGVDDNGESIVLEDTRAEELHALAVEGRDDPRPLLGLRDLFGDLIERTAFVDDLQRGLQALYSRGVRATLAEIL
jgi:fructuronate reductase/mannitol 2-dehydrogenase